MKLFCNFDTINRFWDLGVANQLLKKTILEKSQKLKQKNCLENKNQEIAQNYPKKIIFKNYK